MIPTPVKPEMTEDYGVIINYRGAMANRKRCRWRHVDDAISTARSMGSPDLQRFHLKICAMNRRDRLNATKLILNYATPDPQDVRLLVFQIATALLVGSGLMFGISVLLYAIRSA